MELTITIDGHKQLARNLRVFASRIKNPREFLKEGLDIIASRSDELFANAGRNVQKANTWAPLSPSTQKARANRWGYYKRAPSRPGAMRWTGNLQENRTIRVGSSSGTLTFNADYAAYHQRGGDDLPRRVIVDLSNQTNAELVRALQKLIQKEMGVFGRQA